MVRSKANRVIAVDWENTPAKLLCRSGNPNNSTGLLNHTLRVFLIDASGNIRNIYSSGTLDLRLVLADIRTLMLEGDKHELSHSDEKTAASPVRGDGS